MKNYRNRSLIASVAALVLTPFILQAQNPPAPAEPATPPSAGPQVKDPKSLKWNANLVWISFIVDDGGASPSSYFGAMDKKDLDGVISGATKGFVTIQQVFYYNPATRGFSRFDANVPIAANMVIHKKNGYFRAENISRVIPLNKEFVEFLAVRDFLNVEGVTE